MAFQGALAVSLIVNATMVMGIFYGRSHSVLAQMDVSVGTYVSFFFWQFGGNLLLSFLLFSYLFRVIRKRRESKKTGAIAVGGTLLICIVFSPVLAQFQWLLLGGVADIKMNGFIIFNLIKDTLLSVIVMLITTTVSLADKREKTILVNQKLMAENIRIRYEALKNQLDPHFLFNSLNTLNGLIGTDDDKAHEYVDNLSSVFRYTLHSKTIVHLEQEMEFVDQYVSLLQLRFGDNLRINYNIDERYREYFVMPASLQLLVENAVKHNAISNKTPLSIDIESTRGETVAVSNRINPKSGEKSIGGVGLANLAERYSILFGKSVTITSSEGVFRVEVPLVKEIDKKLKI